MHSISAEMNEPVKKEIYLNCQVLSNDLKEHRESPQSDTFSDTCDEDSVNITKEKDVMIQDLSTNSGSENVLNTQDGVNPEKPQQIQDRSNSNCESQIPCHKGQETSGATSSVEGATRKERVLKPLDLRLQKKSRDNKKRHRLLEPGSSVSLIMEVDEIDDDALYIETGGNEDDRVDRFYLDDWDQHPSVAISPTRGSVMPPDLTDTLLIDVKGIPYTLTPDGRKVPQIDTSKFSNIHRRKIEFHPRSLAVEDSDSDQELFLPNLLSGSSPEETKSAGDQTGPTTLPSLTSLSSLPVQIGATNTDPSSPIRGVLTPSPSKLKSSLESGQLSQTPSVSPVALSPSSGLLDSKSEPVSCTTATDLSGRTNPCNFASSPTSPTSSSTSSNGTKTCSDAPTSFREALLRLAVSAEQKNVNQPKCKDESLSFNHLSCTEVTQAGREDHNTDGSPIFEQAFISMDGTDSSLQSLITTDHSLQSSASSVYLESELLPEGQDPQALGPRRILYCQYCPRIFYFLSDLERHSITHSQKKPHVCQWCDKAFKRSSHLERHKHIHTGERNFECQLCPRRFREAAELSRHQRVHTGEKPYQCLLCHMRFSERNTLRRHTKRKHQGQHHETMHRKRKSKTVEMPEPEEENAEWYSSAVAEMESDNDTGGE